MDVAIRGFAKRNDARIEAMNESAKGNEVQRTVFGNVQTVFHFVSAIDFRGCKT
jgi:hypothetical protein